MSLLRDHPDIRVHSEIFGEYQINDPAIRGKIARKGPVKYMESCFRRMVTEDYVGLKMLYYNIEEQYGAKRGVMGLSSLKDPILNDPDLQFIHLKRLNHVDRLISNARARASGAFLNGKYLDDKIEIDLKWAREELDRMVAWEAQFDKSLPADRTFDTSYEELVADAGAVMAGVFDFLGCTPRPVTSPMKRQKGKPAAESISNYAELKSSLAGTPFAEMMA